MEPSHPVPSRHKAVEQPEDIMAFFGGPLKVLVFASSSFRWVAVTSRPEDASRDKSLASHQCHCSRIALALPDPGQRQHPLEPTVHGRRKIPGIIPACLLCYPLRPLTKMLFWIAPSGYIVKIKSIPKEITVLRLKACTGHTGLS